MKYSTGEIVKNYDVAKARHQRCVVLDAAHGHIAVLEKTDDNHVLIDQVSAGDGFTLLHRCVDMETSLQQLYKLPFSSYSILAQEDGTECFFKCLHMENEYEDRDRKLFEVNASLYFPKVILIKIINIDIHKPIIDPIKVYNNNFFFLNTSAIVTKSTIGS